MPVCSGGKEDACTNGMKLISRYHKDQAKALRAWFEWNEPSKEIESTNLDPSSCSRQNKEQEAGKQQSQTNKRKEAFDPALSALLFEDRIFTLPNNADLVFGKALPDSVDLVMDRKDLPKENWHFFENCPHANPWILPVDRFDPALAALKENEAPVRTHILMNTSMIDEKWCRPALKPLIAPEDEVCVLAFSFFDDTKTLADWSKQYKKGQGIWYRSNTDVFFWYGLKENQVHWVNYFTDDVIKMQDAIRNSNILLLTGGAPDLMMKRIREKKLKKVLKDYQGLIIGYSAGAMVQLADYHITPDEDYPEFSWQKGIGWLEDFDVEVHYHHSRIQKDGMNQAYSAKPKPIYAIEEQGGMIVAPDGTKSFFGKVERFDQNHSDYDL